MTNEVQQTAAPLVIAAGVLRVMRERYTETGDDSAAVRYVVDVLPESLRASSLAFVRGEI